MAHSYLTTSSPLSTPPTASLFEGAEKKLHLVFTPSHDATTEQHHLTSLRSLQRHQVNSITDAAKCTILSMVSNGITDAYLLSESSLFISDTELVIKTCGTTTLLEALPTIINVAASVGLVSARLTFTRVAYLFPDDQPYPHNSFDNEAAYLDDILDCHGHVTRHVSSVSSEWYAYAAFFRPFCNRISPELTLTPRRTLEICMFDLDPHVMRQFMFQDEPSRIGTDSAIGGSTEKSGVGALLVGADVIDAFNFEPCGYSMNALAPCGGYYTIHVTPEDGGSYVSFESTVADAISPHVIADVISTFRPARLTASVLCANDILSDNACGRDGCDECTDDEPNVLPPFDWSCVAKLMHSQYSLISQPHVEKFCASGVSVTAVVAAFSACDSAILTQCTSFGYENKTNGSVWVNEVERCKEDDIVDMVNKALNQVTRECGAVSVNRAVEGKIDFRPMLDDANSNSARGVEQTYPTLIIDLSCLARNYIALRNKNVWDDDHESVVFRFAVRCCFDEYVLRLLSKFPDVVFEAGDALEIQALRTMGVSRERIVLAVAVLTKKHFSLFEFVSSVVVRYVPDEMTMRAMVVAGVGVEVLVDAANIGDEVELVTPENDGCMTLVSSIGLECGGGKGEVKILRGEPNGVRKVIGEWPMHKVIDDGKKKNGERQGWMGEASMVDASEAIMSGGALNIVLTVIGRRAHMNKIQQREWDLFLNDGIYGTLASSELRGNLRHGKLNVRPRALVDDAKTKTTKTTLWGPTCDSTDRIWDGDLVDLDVGQHVAFDDIGPFAKNFVSTFNGFSTNISTSYIM